MSSGQAIIFWSQQAHPFRESVKLFISTKTTHSTISNTKYLTVLTTLILTANAVVLPEAKAEAWNTRWCQTLGQPCWRVKRATDALFAALTKSNGVIERSPEALFSHSAGGEAYMAKRYLNELAGVVASLQSDPSLYYGGLGMGHRFSNDTGEGVEKRETWDTRWCRTVGQPCWKKKLKREAFCITPNEPCWNTDAEAWKAKRDLDAMFFTARSLVESLV